jgi:capsular exopolysaccharide synthesis family protein
MGKIFNALEKYRNERKDLPQPSEQLRPQDLEALMQFNRRTGRLNISSRTVVKDPETVRRLVAHQLIFEDGRITAEGERKVEDLVLRRREALAGPMEMVDGPNGDAAVYLPTAETPDQPEAKRDALSVPTPEIEASPGEGRSAEMPLEEHADSDVRMARQNPPAVLPEQGPIARSDQLHARVSAAVPETKTSAGGRGAAAEAMPPKPAQLKALRRDMDTTASQQPAAGMKRAAPFATEKLTPAHPTASAARMKIDPNMVTLLTPQSFESEQFKILRTNLLYPVEGKPPRSVLVTSVNPGDGKSFVAANLAVSVALNINRYVLLMDCDLRRPTIHRQFGFGDTPGLSEYLSRGAPLPSLLIQTKVDRLSILPGGTPPPNPSELLSSDRMLALVEEVTQRYKDRLIIIDSPPPTMTAETGVLARMAEGIVLVARYSNTNRDDLKKLVDHLGKDKIVGCILNYFDYRSVGLYGYRYYRKYGKYSHS